MRALFGGGGEGGERYDTLLDVTFKHESECEREKFL